MSVSSGSKESKDKKKKNTVNKISRMNQVEEGSSGKKKETTSTGSSESKNTSMKDETFDKARGAVKNTIGWMVQTQSKQSGLLGFFKAATFERNPPENHKTYAFQANREKNRNPDFPLYDHSRVRLKCEAESDNNYVNATNITYFWRMVFYQEIDVIFAIFSPDEQLPVYFPTEQGKFFNHGQFFVHCWKLTPPSGKYQATNYTIEVLPAGCSNARYTTILHYSHWPKGHVAPSPKVILKGIQALDPAEKVTKSKCLIHSAEGINRSMSFVMVDYVVELMFRNNTVDIPELITQLRSQRGGAFQNRIFCLYALYVAIDYVKIRLTKFKNAPEVLLEITNLQKAMKKEFSGVIPRELGSSKKGATIDATIE
ncbi:hypothetical protein GCK72_001519 [Caenorhabditis remanei]|uniref:Tyrosine-protein phosphatase domain-containing protein n=1 Tax=Caenorhabditis remanei TaxID=31234 RepID=A0A6A5HVC7_CAERE|nr:hypothetical protein GCK72_001519 [Caenorhabditis remanei]KAF1769702.1 hypothetical protein GCK72_001519 [Caenorhabditis remanei]